MATMENGAQADSDPIAEISRKAGSILNKIYPHNFDNLVKQFNELPIDNEDKLRHVVEIGFEKAVDEPGFTVTYARMCEVLQKKCVIANNSDQPINFRKLLLSRCQDEFENYLQDVDRKKYDEADIEAATSEERKKELRLEFEEKEMKARRRSLGNIRFIGELYKLKMLTARIMHECVIKLLKAKDEESLECLCRLLSTVGKDLETETLQRLAAAKTQVS